MNIVPGCKALITGTDDPENCSFLVGTECTVVSKIELPWEIELCRQHGINPDHCWNIDVPSCPDGYYGSHERFLLRIDGGEELIEKEELCYIEN